MEPTNTTPAVRPDNGGAAIAPTNPQAAQAAVMKASLANLQFTKEGMALRDGATAYCLVELAYKAGWLPKGVTVEGGVLAVIAGNDVGLKPFQSMQGIAVINGRPGLWGDAMTAVVKGSGQLEDESVEYLTAKNKDGQEVTTGVRYTVKRRGVKTPYQATFTWRDAKQAGLAGKAGPWTQYPVRMMFNRARAWAYRDAFADVLKGFRSAEEDGDIPGAVVEGAPDPTPSDPAETPASAGKIRRGAKPKDMGPIVDADFTMEDTASTAAPSTTAPAKAEDVPPASDADPF